MTPTEIREKTPEEVIKLKKELAQELFHLRMKHASGQMEKHHRLSEVRRDTARVLTILEERTKEKDSHAKVSKNA